MERVAVLEVPDKKLFGSSTYRVLGGTQREGWYFVGQNLRSHFRSPSLRPDDSLSPTKWGYSSSLEHCIFNTKVDFIS